jgi:cytochrome c551/c552
MGAGAAVLALVQRKMLTFLRFAELAHDGLGRVEQGESQIHGHGCVGSQKIDVRFIGHATGETIYRERVQA